MLSPTTSADLGCSSRDKATPQLGQNLNLAIDYSRVILKRLFIRPLLSWPTTCICPTSLVLAT